MPPLTGIDLVLSRDTLKMRHFAEMGLGGGGGGGSEEDDPLEEIAATFTDEDIVGGGERENVAKFRAFPRIFY